jgi:hypothetical protein
MGPAGGSGGAVRVIAAINPNFLSFGNAVSQTAMIPLVLGIGATLSS